MDFFTACLNGDIGFAINVVNTIDLKSDEAKINLLTSIAFNRKTVVKRFLELNIPVKFSEQGFIYAVYLGKIEIVELFLNNNIDEFNLFKKILPKNEKIDLYYCDLSKAKFKDTHLDKTILNNAIIKKGG